MSNAAKSAAAVAPSILEVELPVNFELCIKCQNAHGVLIANPLPGSYEKFLAAVRRRSSLGDTSVSLVHSRLSNFTANDLLEHRATWHTSCYKEVVHVGEIKRVENALKKKLSDFPDKVKLPDTSVQVTNTDTAKVRCFTRSLCQPLNTDACFFCNEGPEKDALHEVTSFNVGKQIHEAVALSENSEWKVKLQPLDPHDARAIDIKYHLYCYVKNVQRMEKNVNDSTKRKYSDSIHEICADTEET
jgi:hypothetical protein